MKKLLKVLFITTVLIYALTIAVSAANSLGVDIKANKDKLKIKEEVTLTLSTTDVNVGTDGINVIETIVNYDKSVFEELKTEQIVSSSDWNIVYNKENGKLIAIKFSEGTKEKQDIFKITLKVKEEVYGTKEEEIKLLNITTNDEKDLVGAGTKSVKVQVEGKPEQEAGKTNQTGDSTTAGGEIPQAGVKSTITIIAILVIITIVIFIRNKKLEGDMKQ